MNVRKKLEFNKGHKTSPEVYNWSCLPVKRCLNSKSNTRILISGSKQQ